MTIADTERWIDAAADWLPEQNHPAIFCALCFDAWLSRATEPA